MARIIVNRKRPTITAERIPPDESLEALSTREVIRDGETVLGAIVYDKRRVASGIQHGWRRADRPRARLTTKAEAIESLLS